LTKIKFYTDEHIPNAVVKGLLKRGIDMLSCVEAGNRTATDKEHLTYANQTQRVLLTCDADFLRFHQKGVKHCGIVHAKQSMSIGEMIR